MSLAVALGVLDILQMKWILFLFCFELLGCENTQSIAQFQKVRARVTYYGKWEDKFGSRIAMTSKYRAVEGRTLAAPAVFPFLQKVSIPLLDGVVGNGKFVVEDRGSYLEKAYRQGELRLDVYVANRKKCRQLGGSLPEYMEAELQ